ncbi:hypothetical protein LXL04_012793 [Taraxacum kok-saghyz]
MVHWLANANHSHQISLAYANSLNYQVFSLADLANANHSLQPYIIVMDHCIWMEPQGALKFHPYVLRKQNEFPKHLGTIHTENAKRSLAQALIYQHEETTD